MNLSQSECTALTIRKHSLRVARFACGEPARHAVYTGIYLYPRLVRPLFGS